MRYCFSAVYGETARHILSIDGEMQVIAVHSESVYIRSVTGALLLFCSDKYGSVPFGVSLEDYGSFRALREYREGDRVLVRGGEICFDDGCRICIRDTSTFLKGNKSTALPESECVLACAELLMKTASKRGIAPAVGALLCIGTPAAESNVYAMKVAACADTLEQAFLHRDGAALSRVISGLIGLGYGLTPSGDDFVCGMLYAFCRYGSVVSDAKVYREMLSLAVEEHLSMTNEVSAMYLRCALDGGYFEVVEGVFDALSNADGIETEMLRYAVGRLISVGASSGSDILCGMLFAIYLLGLER